MKKIFVFSVSRSDYDRYFPILEALQKENKVKLYLILSSAHYAEKFGRTINFIDKKFNIIKRKKISKIFNDKPNKVIDNLADDIKFLSQNVYKHKPDIVIVLGDRLEMIVAPIVSIPYNIPVIHLYGGAITEGAVDELVRHAITKLSHYHFVALNSYKKRLLQLGEENWRIKVSGVHGVNLFKSFKKMNLNLLSEKLSFDLKKPYLLLTFHPTTLENKKISNQTNALVKAIKRSNLNTIITYPNADIGHDKIINLMKKKLYNKKKYLIIKNCGIEIYSNLMRNCLAIIGNSSSGIVEATSFNVPAINIGSRQNGKYKPENVIDCSNSSSDIYNKILMIKRKKFLKKIKNPYESRISIKQMVRMILSVKKNDKFMRKKFINLI